jgi:DegV family protein with EDD domain
MIPLNIHFGDSFYLDRVTMQPEQFYNMLDTSADYPSTSQPSHKEFYNRFNYLSTHFDSIIAIHLSNKMSGTWQNSLNAATKVSEETGNKIDVINSNRVCNPLGLMALRASRALEEGMDHDNIVANLPKWSKNTRVLVNASTMKYMVRSGRVSKTKGFIGNLLGVKPIVTINNDGKTESFGKPLTMKQSRKMIIADLEKYIDGKKVWGYAISHAQNQPVADFYADKLEEMTGKKPEFIQNASPVLVTHVGIGVVAVTVMLD